MRGLFFIFLQCVFASGVAHDLWARVYGDENCNSEDSAELMVQNNVCTEFVSSGYVVSFRFICTDGGNLVTSPWTSSVYVSSDCSGAAYMTFDAPDACTCSMSHTSYATFSMSANCEGKVPLCPTFQPTYAPTSLPSLTLAPTVQPSTSPSSQPSKDMPTGVPTSTPSLHLITGHENSHFIFNFNSDGGFLKGLGVLVLLLFLFCVRYVYVMNAKNPTDIHVDVQEIHINPIIMQPHDAMIEMLEMNDSSSSS